MKLSRFFSGLFLSCALAMMGLALILIMSQPGATPTLLSPAEEAQDQVAAAMDALCAGDFSAVEQYLIGQPSLGADREPQSAEGALVWDAFLDSFSYELSGKCYATDIGVAQDVSLTYLDISSVTANLAQRSEDLLTRMQHQATHTSEIYDEEGNFRADVVQQVLYTAVQDAISQDAQYTTSTFTLQLVKQGDRWYIVPNSDFIRAISGGM